MYDNKQSNYTSTSSFPVTKLTRLPDVEDLQPSEIHHLILVDKQTRDGSTEGQ